MVDKPDTVTPDSPATDDETAEAEKLRAALDDPTLASEDAELARALGAAWSPRDLTASKHEALVERALAGVDAVNRRKRIVRVSFGAGTVLALAASVAVVVSTGRQRTGAPGPAGGAVVAMSRSTQALFAERFAALGGETWRVDRISLARAGDLRENEFAKWGVR